MSSFAKNSLYKLLLGAGFARAISAAGAVLLIIILARNYGASAVGEFALLQTIIIGLSIFGRFGMNNALMRELSKAPDSDKNKKYIIHSLAASITISAALGLIVLASENELKNFFNISQINDFALLIFLTLPTFSGSIIFSGVMKGYSKPATSCLLENGAISLITISFILTLQASKETDINSAAWYYCISSLFIFSYGAVKSYRTARLASIDGEAKTIKIEELKYFASLSTNFFLLSLAILMQQVVSVLIIGKLVSSEELGLFKAAERIALTINFTLIVINTVFPAKFSFLYTQNKKEKLGMMAQKSSAISTIVSIIPTLAIVIFPAFFLALFGNDFLEAQLALTILALGQFFNCMTGSTTFLLSMTGHERLVRNIAIISNVAALGLVYYLTLSYGIIGAAVALSISYIMQNIAAFIYIKLKLDIWMLPIWRRPS